MQSISDDFRPHAMARAEGLALGLCLWLTAVLHNRNGHYGEALTPAQEGCGYQDVMAYGRALVELIQAGARANRPGATAAALDRLSERTQARGTEWALGIEAGPRALLSEGEAAESLDREAMQWLTRSRAVVHLTRARLRYGEWLRREPVAHGAGVGE